MTNSALKRALKSFAGTWSSMHLCYPQRSYLKYERYKEYYYPMPPYNHSLCYPILPFHFCIHVVLIYIMKRKFKELWSTISIKQTIISLDLFKSLNITRTSTYIYIYTYDIGNPCSLFDQAHKSGGVKFVEIVHVLDIH